MAAPEFLGNQNAVKQPVRHNWDTDTGQETTEVYDGSRAVIAALFAQELANPANAWGRIEVELGPVARIAMTTQPFGPGAAGETETWELDRNTIKMPLRSHPYWSQYADTAGQSPYMDTVDLYLARNQTPDWAGDDFAGADARTKRYYYFRLANVNSQNYSTYVVRRIRYVGKDADVAIESAGDNTVVEFPNGPPAEWITIGHEYEWLQQPTDIRSAGGGRMEYVKEWWGGTPLWGVHLGGTWDPSDGLI